MSSKLPEIIIVRDTREQQGWIFPEEDKRPGRVRICGTAEETLNAGDYSIQGYTDLVRIERKNGWSELFGNYSPASNKERFEREMEKLRDIKHKFILIETLLMKDSLGLSVPQYKSQGPPVNKILSWLIEISVEYDVHVQFVGDAGQRTAKTIFENIARKYL